MPPKRPASNRSAVLRLVSTDVTRRRENAGSWLGFLRRRRQLKLLDAIADLIAIESEQLRRTRLIPACALERLHDEMLLGFLEIEAGRRQFNLVRVASERRC